MTKTAEQTRAIEYVERCREDLRKALVARDAIEDCTSHEWRVAHASAKTAAIAKSNAFRHAYDVGALPRPYWA